MSVTKRISTGDYNLITAGSDANVIITTDTLKIYGNLYVQGNTSVVNVANISTADPTITLNSNVTTPFLGNSGIEVYRGPTAFTTALFWNETVSNWQVATNIANPGTYSNISTELSGTGSVFAGTATHFPFYANTGEIVEDAGANITWTSSNTLTVTGNTVTTTFAVNGTNITASAPGAGGTGINFSNGAVTGELISKKKALFYSIIFG